MWVYLPKGLKGKSYVIQWYIESFFFSYTNAEILSYIETFLEYKLLEYEIYLSDWHSCYNKTNVNRFVGH